jgi:hypothetical protein
VITGLTEGTSYYFRLWTQDDVGQWSAISNQTTAYIQIGVRSIVLSTGSYNFGSVAVGLSTQTTAAITVTYTGNVSSTFRLYASTVTPGGSPWSLATSTSSDQGRLFAGFNATQPGMGSFLSPEDVVLTGSQTCTASVFAIGETCVGVAPGSTRTLWLRWDMPGQSSTEAPQQIQLTVEAGP